MWLPPKKGWSGRYYQLGNGGFAGSIDRKTLAAAADRGDAAAATDTGHQGTGFDASWAAGRPDLVEDYTWRSIKVTSDTANALVTRYYGRAPQRRYFMGCSFGGRQALVAASRWPADWDGAIAGAPAVEWVDWLTSFARIQHRLRATPDNWIPAMRIGPLSAIARTGRGPAVSVLAHACRRGNRSACLSRAQATSLAAIERAGFALADADPAEWKRWIVNVDPDAPSQALLAREAFRYVFADSAGWTVSNYASGIEPGAAQRVQFAVGSLTPFLRKGGKLITYIGTADAVLPPIKVAAAIRARLPGTTLRERGYRRLMLPGMAHCQGGMQPHAFGQSLSAGRSANEEDIRRVLERWVENGRTPITITTVQADVGRRSVMQFLKN